MFVRKLCNHNTTGSQFYIPFLDFNQIVLFNEFLETAFPEELLSVFIVLASGQPFDDPGEKTSKTGKTVPGILKIHQYDFTFWNKKSFGFSQHPRSHLWWFIVESIGNDDAVQAFILERDARREGKTIVGDKSPNSLLNGKAVKLMHKVYPDASLIYIIRDGRDAVVSHRFQTFIDGTQHLSKEDWRIRQAFTRKADQFMEGERSIFTEKGIRRAG